MSRQLDSLPNEMMHDLICLICDYQPVDHVPRALSILIKSVAYPIQFFVEIFNVLLFSNNTSTCELQ